jgi:hypothetical protein
MDEKIDSRFFDASVESAMKQYSNAVLKRVMIWSSWLSGTAVITAPQSWHTSATAADMARSTSWLTLGQLISACGVPSSMCNLYVPARILRGLM